MAEMVLRVGDKFKAIGDKDAVIANYEHFIKGLRRFTMVPLEEAIKINEERINVNL